MHFITDAVPTEQFAQWVSAAGDTGSTLDAQAYADLAKPSKVVVPFTYHAVSPDLFGSIVKSALQSGDELCLSNLRAQRVKR
jgi:cytochrome o ubiquinol oxidase subunit II